MIRRAYDKRREPHRISRRRLPFLFLLARRIANAHAYAGASGEAGFWLEPDIELARNYGLSDQEISRALRLIREKEHDIRRAWNEHFGS